MSPMSFLKGSLLLTALAVISVGCGVTPSSSSSSSGSSGSSGSVPLALNGHVMGGQQPVSGATIQLYAAGSSGYGSASTGLLTSAVTTDASGSFTITDLYTCPSSATQVYLTARGGNPGLSGTVDNQALTMMAALGSCGNLSSSTYVVMNEATTVAAVWALAPFMTAYDHVGTSSTNPVGLANAFAMAANLASTTTGQSPGNTPAGAVISVTTINTLANILMNCVNTPGGTAGDSTPCGNLFAITTPGAGASPTEIAGAALYIAQHPGTSVSAIFALEAAVTVFQPTLTSAPNDWTVSATFPTGGTSLSSMAIDAGGNVWVQDGTLHELSPAGAVLGSYPAMAGQVVAIDASGNFWSPAGLGTISKMPSTLGTPTAYSAPGTSLYGVGSMAIDASGAVWYTCGYCTSVGKLNASGTFLFNAGLPTNQNSSLAIDTSGNVWVGSEELSDLSVVTNSGATYLTSPFPCGRCSSPGFVASDGNGNVWATGGLLTKMTSTGGYTNFGTSSTRLGAPLILRQLRSMAQEMSGQQTTLQYPIKQPARSASSPAQEEPSHRSQAM